MEQARTDRTSRRQTAQGACPGCGDLVPTFPHSSDGRTATVLACTTCGRTTHAGVVRSSRVRAVE